MLATPFDSHMEVMSRFDKVTGDGYAVEGLHGQAASSCPRINSFEKYAQPILPRVHGEGFNPRGIELLPGDASKDSAGSCLPLHGFSIHYILYNYMNILSGVWPEQHNCLMTMGRSRDLEAGKGIKKKRPFDNDALTGYYSSLQYQCSQVVNGVLCDYSVDPPLSVDAEGRFLNKKLLSKQSSANLYVTGLTTTSVEYAVIAMLAVAFVAIFGTLAVLGGTQVVYEGLQYFWAYLHKLVSSRVGWCSRAAHEQ